MNLAIQSVFGRPSHGDREYTEAKLTESLYFPSVSPLGSFSNCDTGAGISIESGAVLKKATPANRRVLTLHTGH